MGWSLGFDSTWNRDIGYGVPAYCDHPKCFAEIDRGLSYVCGNAPYGGEHGCGLYFCAQHLLGDSLCVRCQSSGRPFSPSAEHPQWIRHKLTDPSWEEWRSEHPAEVAKLLVLTIKALTICQPYPALILLGEKPIENRTWPTNYRGPLAIHAGKSRTWLDDGDETRYPDMAFGAVVAVAVLYDCVHVKKLPPELAKNEHANGPWCWLLRDVRRITPVPYKGAQGLWLLPAHLVGEEAS